MTSQQTMVNWAKDNVYKWIDMDGMYGAQCVDLTMAYVKNFADFQIYGNAIDYLTNPIPPGWRRYYKGDDEIAPGDIANPDETFFHYIAIIVDALSFVVSVGNFSEFAWLISNIYRRNFHGEMTSFWNPSPFFS